MVEILINPNETNLSGPLPFQMEFWNDVSHYGIAFVSGWGAGKTFSGARAFVERLIMLNGLDGGGLNGLVVGTSYRDSWALNASEVCSALDERNVAYKLNRMDSFIYLPQLRSTIYVRSAQSPESIRGFEVVVVWCDEAAAFSSSDDPMRDSFTQILGRLRQPFKNPESVTLIRQLLVTTTEEGDGTKFHKLFASNANWITYKASSESNPFLDRATIKEWKSTLSEEQYSQYVRGGCIDSSSGLIYRGFNPTTNLKPLTYSPTNPLLLSFDFNISPGMHCLVLQYDGECIKVLKELHGKRWSVLEIISELNEWLSTLGLAHLKVIVYGDATGNSEWSGIGRSNYEILIEGLGRVGIRPSLNVPRANPPIVNRVNAVNSAFLSADGVVHLLIDPMCKVLIRDLENMSYNDLGGISQRDKMLSHASDALGYAVHRLRPCRSFRTKPQTECVTK